MLDRALAGPHPVLLFPTPHAQQALAYYSEHLATPAESDAERPHASLIGPSSIAAKGSYTHGGLTSRGAGVVGCAAIDGSWRFAKSVYRWSPQIARACRPITVTPTAPSVLGSLKREPSATATSTMEAVAMALGALLHGDEQSVLTVGRRAA